MMFECKESNSPIGEGVDGLDGPFGTIITNDEVVEQCEDLEVVFGVGYTYKWCHVDILVHEIWSWGLIRDWVFPNDVGQRDTISTRDESKVVLEGLFPVVPFDIVGEWLWLRSIEHLGCILEVSIVTLHPCNKCNGIQNREWNELGVTASADLVASPLDQRGDAAFDAGIDRDATLGDGQGRVRLEVIGQLVDCLVHARVKVVVEHVSGHALCVGLAKDNFNIINATSCNGLADGMDRWNCCGHGYPANKNYS
mmetsp:Transcript_26164/g.37185  ORF Transcript_26164/g.37185 Transcript_26164/m.37185 type:complete len:253 (-) Transcript_26164:111-869(-)